MIRRQTPVPTRIEKKSRGKKGKNQDKRKKQRQRRRGKQLTWRKEVVVPVNHRAPRSTLACAAAAAAAAYWGSTEGAREAVGKRGFPCAVTRRHDLAFSLHFLASRVLLNVVWIICNTCIPTPLGPVSPTRKTLRSSMALEGTASGLSPALRRGCPGVDSTCRGQAAAACAPA